MLLSKKRFDFCVPNMTRNLYIKGGELSSPFAIVRLYTNYNLIEIVLEVISFYSFAKLKIKRICIKTPSNLIFRPNFALPLCMFDFA